MEKIYYGGNIITMETDSLPEAILISDGIIKDIGNYETILKNNPNSEKIDLKGKTLLPSFIDAHSHFSAYANSFLQAPLEECCSFDEIEMKIKNYISTNNIKVGCWVIGKGYDQNNLVEQIHPTKDFLDKTFPDYPIMLMHKSGHMGVCNSLAFKILDITINTKSASSGKIDFEKGYLEEDCFMEYMKKIPMPDVNALISAYKKAQKSYASFGITTIQEGMMVKEMIPFYKYLLDNSLLYLDVVGYCEIKSSKLIADSFALSLKKYHKNFKIGGYKIFLDGSPQGRTAWMIEPYQNNGGSEPYYGYGTMSDNEVLNVVEKSARDNMQILVHCNGDRACEQFINAMQKAQKEYTNLNSLRPVAIHAQLMNEQQLDMCKTLGIIPSFFVAHVYHWGDVHIKNFGFNRAQKISIAKSAIDKNIIFTFHQDSPVIEPNVLETIWCAVARKTKSGKILGEDQKISVYNALKAVTINSAYSYFEENEKGSIKIGKKADLIILSDNPLTVNINEIKNIKVLETIKNGETIFKI